MTEASHLAPRTRRSLGDRLRRHWRRTVLIIILLWILGAALLVASAYRDLTGGRDQLLGLRDDFDSVSLDSGDIDTQLTSATTKLQRGHRKLANPVVAPFRLLPYLGRQLSSATAISGTAATAADVAGDSLAQARGLTEAVKTDRAGALAKLSTITEDADKRLLASSLGPDRALLPPLADARNQMATQLADIHSALSRASAGSGAMAELLNSDHTYLVVAANNGEMRAGAGMFLSAGTLTTGNGQLTLNDISTVGTVTAPTGSVPWPTDMADRWGWIGYNDDFRNLMMSPRFDQSAPLAAQIWEKAGKGTVDGVMVIDPVMLQSLLRATGSVKAGDLTVSADNVLDQLLIEQYRNINYNTSTVAAQDARRDGLSGIASSTFAALNNGNWNPVILAREMGKAADARHLLVWAKDADLNARWVTAGVGGELGQDSMMLSSVNVGANKLDQFMKTQAVVDQRIATNGIDITVKVTMANNTPGDAPRYVLGPAPNTKLDSGEYSGLLSFNLPQDARNVRFDGNPELVALGADGPNQTIATNVRIKKGQTATLTLRFTRSANARSTTVEASGRYPATTWIAGTKNGLTTHRIPWNTEGGFWSIREVFYARDHRFCEEM